MVRMTTWFIDIVEGHAYQGMNGRNVNIGRLADDQTSGNSIVPRFGEVINEITCSITPRILT